MNKLTIAYRPAKIAKVINAVNKYNANHDHRNMDGLVKKAIR